MGSEDGLDAVLDRVEGFFDSLHEGDTDPEDLVVTQDELNGFVGHSDFLRGNLEVRLHEGRIVESFSLPMDELGLGERYFVGSDYLDLKDGGEGGGSLVEMEVETEAGHEDWFDGPLVFLQLRYLITKIREGAGQTMLELFLEKGSFFGQAVPEEAIAERKNLLESLYQPENAEALEDILKLVDGIESVSIEEGRLVVKANHKSN